MRFVALSAVLITISASAAETNWEAQSREDGKRDIVRVIWEGKTPNKLVCDTTLRQVPDGSWVMVMLGGGDKEPMAKNRIFFTRSLDRGETWSEMRPIDFGVKKRDPNTALVPTELMVHQGRCTIFFATHSGKFGDWKSWYSHSDDSCRTWGPLLPLPEPLDKSSFVRNRIVTSRGDVLLPFQHYVSEEGPRNPRNGVLATKDGGETWSVHGWIRISEDDNYRGWAEPNIVELEDGSISMIVRADGLGGDSVAILHNPNPKERNPLSLWVSFDGMKTWPYRRTLVEWPGRLNYPDGFVDANGEYLHFAFDDNRYRAIYVGAKLPDRD